jgi:putative mRNA 3-end processing factor
MATDDTLAIMALRYGRGFRGRRPRQRVLGERIEIGGVSVTFHPAGHVLGSAQIAVEQGGTRIVASGDYKRQARPHLPETFEPVACDIFITEATFGLPVFRHPDPGRGRGGARCSEIGASFRSGRIWSAPMRSARRSA